MTRQIIDTTTNNGAYIGDPAVVAFEKVNENFAELYDLQGQLATRSGKNKLINGTMNVWQRQISFALPASAGIYTADRWLFNTGAGVSATVSRIQMALGEVDLFPWSMAIGISALGGGVNMRQSIEGVHTLGGRTAILSFWARANAAGAALGTRGTQVFGSGGSANTSLVGGGNISLTTGWVRYTVPLTVPGIVGKVIGGNNCLQIIFDFLAPTTYWIVGVQLEEGPDRTDFEYPFASDELQRCMRYYEKSYDIGVFPGTGSGFGRCGEFLGVNPRNTANSWVQRFSVMKRATPSLAVYASENGQANAVSQASGTNVAINSLGAVGQNGFQVTYVNGSGQYGASFHYTADAEF